jgi:hypothetical protein
MFATLPVLLPQSCIDCPLRHRVSVETFDDDFMSAIKETSFDGLFQAPSSIPDTTKNLLIHDVSILS